MITSARAVPFQEEEKEEVLVLSFPSVISWIVGSIQKSFWSCLLLGPSPLSWLPSSISAGMCVWDQWPRLVVLRQGIQGEDFFVCFLFLSRPNFFFFLFVYVNCVCFSFKKQLKKNKYIEIRTQRVSVRGENMIPRGLGCWFLSECDLSLFFPLLSLFYDIKKFQQFFANLK